MTRGYRFIRHSRLILVLQNGGLRNFYIFFYLSPQKIIRFLGDERYFFDDFEVSICVIYGDLKNRKNCCIVCLHFVILIHFRNFRHIIISYNR